MRSVAVFKWQGELSSDDEDDPERLTVELARPAAETLLAELRNRGYVTNVETPYSGEGGWHFTIDVEDRTYSVFTMWTGIGKPDEDYFAVQPLLQRGFFGTLFVRRPPDDILEPLCLVLDATLKEIPSVTHLQWLTDQEFKKAYCDGEPLPEND
jgi:hypothetical protein